MFKFEIETTEKTTLSPEEFYSPDEAVNVASRIWSRISPKTNVLAMRVIEQDGTVEKEWVKCL